MTLKHCVFAVAVMITASPTTATSQTDEMAALEAALQAYEDALNSNDAEAVAETFSEDGVWMPQNSLPIEGRDAIKSAYAYFFANVRINAALTIDEIVRTGPDWAFIRSQGLATLVQLESGAEMPAANQEIFILQRQDNGDWKLARYIFTSTQPLTD
ncbi:MAG: SgcJ/EcaC family oxidoreductase [Pseudomonadota bacterium]